MTKLLYCILKFSLFLQFFHGKTNMEDDRLQEAKGLCWVGGCADARDLGVGVGVVVGIYDVAISDSSNCAPQIKTLASVCPV